MPRFKRTEATYEDIAAGVYLTQIIKAKQQIAKTSGNDMLTLTLRDLIAGWLLTYYLSFSGKGDGLITAFCHRCEGELILPGEPGADFSLTAADCLHRLVFIEVELEEDPNDKEHLRPRIKIPVLSRTLALARVPELAQIKLPANVPPSKQLAAFSVFQQATSPRPAPPAGPNDLDAEPDDLPF